MLNHDEPQVKNFDKMMDNKIIFLPEQIYRRHDNSPKYSSSFYQKTDPV